MFRPVLSIFLSTLLIISVTALPKQYDIKQVNNEVQESKGYVDLGDDNSNLIPNKDANAEYLSSEIKDLHAENDMSNADDVRVGAVGGWGNQNHGVHNLTVGHKTYKDKFLYSVSLTKAYRSNRIVQTNVYGNSPNGEIISFIEAYDTHSNPNDAGYASIIAGGVRSKNVKIHLESARGQNLEYYVRVFGH